MNRETSYIRYLTVLMVVTILALGCRREPVEDKETDAALNVSALQSNVVRLDTMIFINPVRNNGQVRFDLAGTPPQIQTGDIVYYPGSGALYGKVISTSIVGSRIFLQIEKTSIDQVFKSIVILDNNSKKLVISTNRVEPDGWNSDTMDLSGLSLYNDIWESKRLEVRFDSGKLFTSSYVGSFSLAGEGSNPWFDRLGLVGEYSLNFGGELIVATSGEMDALDSMRVERKLLGPFVVNGFPVTYQVDTWVGFHVITQSDTVVTMKFESGAKGKLSLSYNYWEDWKFARNSTEQFADISEFKGPRLSDYFVELFVNQSITPIFSGEPSLDVVNRLSVNIAGQVTIPNWQSSQSAKATGRMVRNGSVFGTMVPAALEVNENVLFTESQNGVLENQKPKAAFLIDPLTGFTDTNFEFDASGSSDLETPGESLEVRWDFDGDDHFDTEFSSTKVAFHTYTQPGSYTPVLEVKDGEGLTSRTTSMVDVTLTSSAPIAFFTVTPESGRISDIFIFDAYGCYDSQDNINQLKVRWDFDGDGTWETNWSTRKIEYYVFRTEGTYVAKLEVLDTQGLSGSTTRLIHVAPANIKPTAFYTVIPESGTTETRFDFDASGSSDPEDPSEGLLVRWDWENDGFFDTGYRTLKTIQHIFPVAGSYTVVVEVIDSELYGATYSRIIQVANPNTAPDADFLIIPSTGTVGEMISFDASSCVDAQDSLDQLEVRWDWDNDNIFDTPYSTEKIFRRTFNETGTYIIKVQVRDSGGLTDTRARLLVIY